MQNMLLYWKADKRKRMPHPGIRFFGIAVVCTYFAVM